MSYLSYVAVTGISGSSRAIMEICGCRLKLYVCAPALFDRSLRNSQHSSCLSGRGLRATGGGAFIALLVSMELGCDFVYAQRFVNPAREGLYPVEYRLPQARYSAVKGQRVAIVNDVISAGSAVRGAFRNLRSVGANVVAIGALLALGDTVGVFAAEHHVALELLQ